MSVNQVQSNFITDGSITTAKIADGNVTTAKIADGNVTTAKIADGNVTTAKINDSAITSAKIADGNVTTAKINDSAVRTAKIADGAITPAKVSNDTYTMNITGNSATATTAASCSGNAATATTAASCSGNSATATTATTANNGAVAFACINNVGTTGNNQAFVLLSKYNISGCSRIASGTYRITFATPLASDSYVVVGSARPTTGAFAGFVIAINGKYDKNGFDCYISDSTGNPRDGLWMYMNIAVFIN